LGKFTEGKLVNKSQLIDTLAARYEGNRKQAAQALEAVIDTITREVAKGEKVAITGFGSFEKRVRDARWVRNPRTGERLKAKKTAVPKFNAGADLKAVVSGAKKLPKLTLNAATTTARAATGTTAKAPAKKTTSTAKKTTATSPAKKTAAKTTAKKSTATKSTATTKAPAKKTATKTTATKSAAKKSAPASSTTSKTTAPAKRATATKAPAKKTTTATKAPAKKTTTKRAAKKS
jgi:DNA-binding protein HU-beta